jgi:hypothetical protein
MATNILALLRRPQRNFIIALHRKHPELTLGQEPSLAFLLSYAHSLLQRVANREILHSTFRAYMSHLRTYFKIHGWNMQTFDRVELQNITYFRLRRIPVNYLRTKSSRHLITVSLLRTVCLTTQKNGFRHDDVVITTLALVAFFGLVRTYELLHSPTHPETMDWSQVSLTAQSDFRITLSHPKINKSYTQYIQPIRQDGILNPHHWLTNLQTFTGGSKDMWHSSTNSRLYTTDFLSSFARLANIQANSLDCSSFRAGGATFLLHSGYSHSFIKTFGRWDSESFVVYLRSLPDAFYNSNPISSN